MTSPDKLLRDDLLAGAEAISAYTGIDIRRVYYLGAKGALPTFQLGATVCARKSELDRKLSAERGRAA